MPPIVLDARTYRRLERAAAATGLSPRRFVGEAVRLMIGAMSRGPAPVDRIVGVREQATRVAARVAAPSSELETAWNGTIGRRGASLTTFAGNSSLHGASRRAD